MDTNLFYKKNFNFKKIPKEKKILILGCSGFISLNLLECLLQNNEVNKNQYYGVDIVSPGIKNKNFFFKKVDLYQLKSKIFNKIKFDYIINIAGIPSPVFYKKKPLETIYLNFDLSRIFLKRAARDDAKFIFFSSSEIYGNPDAKHIPTKESYPGIVSTISDRATYDESKRLGETITMVYRDYFNVDCKIIRPFNFYGPKMRMNDGRIIPKFVELAKKNKNLTVYDDGKQTRTYCHIWDAVIMIVNVIFLGKKFIYNIGNDKGEISAKNLAIKIKKIYGNKSNVVLKKYPNGYPSAEPRRRKPNIENFKSEFNYRPKINLFKGLKNIA